MWGGTLLSEANSIVSMAESLKFALEKEWYDRAILLAEGLKKITEMLETEIEDTQIITRSLKISEELQTLYELQI